MRHGKFHWATMVGCLGVFSAVLAGCKSGETTRAGVQFHAEGVRLNMQMVLKAIPNPSDAYGMWGATEGLTRALSGLPERVQAHATTRVPERVEAAKKAVALFIQLQPVLNSLKYDQDQARAKLDELSKLIDEVERE